MTICEMEITEFFGGSKMIIDSFDPDSEAIVSPKAFFGEQRKYIPDGLREANHDLQKFYAALCIAEEIGV